MDRNQGLIGQGPATADIGAPQGSNQSNEDRLIGDVYRRIERERAIIQGSRAMRASTQNVSVQQRCDTSIHEAQKNIAYLEEVMRGLKLKKQSAAAATDNSSTGGSSDLSSATLSANSGGSSGGLMPGSAHQHNASSSSAGGSLYSNGSSDASTAVNPLPPPVPTKDRVRPNYARLDLLKYDNPYMGPRIQAMLQQLEFKLSVEQQYERGVEKMIKLYQLEGDKRSQAEADQRHTESIQKVQLLKKALKRYQDMHIDLDEPTNDNDSIAAANMRRPLSGIVHIACYGVKDVDHVASGKFGKFPDSMIALKVEGQQRARTKFTRTERWNEEFNISVDKANEIEVVVYDRSGDRDVPVGLMWLRISDIAEALRRKKVEQEIDSAGWVSASKVQYVDNSSNNSFASNPNQASGPGVGNSYQGVPGSLSQGMRSVSGDSAFNGDNADPLLIDSWFTLEPSGQIHLAIGFQKTNRGQKRTYDHFGALGRQGAIKQRKEEVHEVHGHKFAQQQFYNIMRCALCGDFLKYSAGYQCQECRYTCHKKCYPKVVTKCISKASTDPDPDEEKLNHRIPHRFEPTTNMSANWCCHCGYILPLGKKTVRKCTECGIYCHPQCAHLVPDLCGLSMEAVNQILSEIKSTKIRKQAMSSPDKYINQQTSPDNRYSQNSGSGYQQPPHPVINPYGVRTVSGTSIAAPPPPPKTDPVRRKKVGSEPVPNAFSVSPQRENATLYGSDGADSQSNIYGQQHNSQNYGNATYQKEDSADYSSQKNAYSNVPELAAQDQSDYTSHPDLSFEAGRTSPEYDAYNSTIPTSQQSPRSSTINVVSQPAHTDFNGYYDNQEPFSSKESSTAAALSNLSVSTNKNTGVATQSPVPRRKSPVRAEKKRKVGLDDFNFLAVLGKGNFGKVMLAESKKTKRLYAVKVLKKDFIIENDEVESTKSEKRVFLIAQNHPFLLNLYSCFQTENRVYFVMEYISGGDLMWHIQKELFTPRRAQFYAAEVLLALKYFHDNGVIYRDLKLDNIMLTLDGHIKIADYGLCKEDMWYGKTTGTFCGTPEFMAPEILLEQKYGRAVDWWAFGVLIYQMLLGKSPFRGDDEDEVFDAILSDEPLYPIHMPRDSVSILQELLTRDPEKRLGTGPRDAEEVMAHPYFRNINFDDIYHFRVGPPYVPHVDSPTDVRNFDREFTDEPPALTPVTTILTAQMQEQFKGFSYMSEEQL